jgi:hypothetical protein
MQSPSNTFNRHSVHKSVVLNTLEISAEVSVEVRNQGLEHRYSIHSLAEKTRFRSQKRTIFR